MPVLTYVWCVLMLDQDELALLTISLPRSTAMHSRTQRYT
jgi:hypothetical protein